MAASNPRTDMDIEEYFTGQSLTPACIAMLFVSVSYYLFYVVKRPVLVGNKTFQDFLIAHCPSLTEKYWPTFWCYGSRAQTVIRTIFKSHPKTNYKREVLTLSDGGQVALDWVHNPTDKYHIDAQPTVIILPGLTGDSQQSYALHWAQEAVKLGYRPVVFNYRGNGGLPLKTGRTYSAANTDDLEAVIKSIKSKFPASPLIAAGVSLGGMIITNYLSRLGRNCQLVAALVVSAPFNTFKSSESLEQPLNWFLFNDYLTNNLINHVKVNSHLFKDMKQLNLDKVYKSRTVRQFDENFIVKSFGYKDCAEYYNDAMLTRKVGNLPIPTLYLNAEDDVFSPGDAFPIKQIEESSTAVMASTTFGGHIGFLEGVIPTQRSLMDRVFSEYVDAIFTHGDKL